MKKQKLREPWLPVIHALLVVVSIPCTHAEEPPPELLPSDELLEFLTEFDDVDDETFALLLERAERDVAEGNTEKASEEKGKSDKRGNSDE